MIRNALALLLLLLALAAPALAQTPVAPSQRDVLSNSSGASTSNAAKVVTLTGVSGQQWRIYGLSAFCSAGTSTLTIAEASVTKWVSNTGGVGTSIIGVAWTPAPFTAARGATVVVTLGTCGSGNTGTLNVQADRY